MCSSTLKSQVLRVAIGFLLYLVRFSDFLLRCFHGTGTNRVQPSLFLSSCCSTSTAVYFKPELEFRSETTPPPPSQHSLTLPPSPPPTAVMYQWLLCFNSDTTGLIVNLIQTAAYGPPTAGGLARRLALHCLTAWYPRTTCSNVKLTF